MSEDVLKRLAQQIDIEGIGEMTALELQSFMFHAGIGLSRQTIEKHLKEAYFASVLIPTAWKPGKGARNVDKSVLMNVSRWRKGPRFEDVLTNGHKDEGVTESAGPAHA